MTKRGLTESELEHEIEHLFDSDEESVTGFSDDSVDDKDYTTG